VAVVDREVEEVTEAVVVHEVAEVAEAVVVAGSAGASAKGGAEDGAVQRHRGGVRLG
jgi:hypothetical protein